MAKQKKTNLDLLFLDFLKKEGELFLTWQSDQIKKGVSLQIIKDKVQNDIQEIEFWIFNRVNIEDSEQYSDPFMANFLIEFNDLCKFKEKEAITVLFSKRKEIDAKTRKIKFWSESDYINQSDEKLVAFIAKYKFLHGIIALLEPENSFLKWQNEYKFETNSFFYPNAISKFLAIEKEVFLKSFITINGKWNSEKNYLVAFILTLIDNSFINKYSGGKKLTDVALRTFFENRYSIDIAKEFQQNKREQLKSKTVYFAPFKFIND